MVPPFDRIGDFELLGTIRERRGVDPFLHLPLRELDTDLLWVEGIAIDRGPSLSRERWREQTY
jgi:hypothetical protein